MERLNSKGERKPVFMGWDALPGGLYSLHVWEKFGYKPALNVGCDAFVRTSRLGYIHYTDMYTFEHVVPLAGQRAVRRRSYFHEHSVHGVFPSELLVRLMRGKVKP